MSKPVKTKYCTYCKQMYKDKEYPNNLCLRCGHQLVITIAFQDNFHIVKDAEIVKEEPLK